MTSNDKKNDPQSTSQQHADLQNNQQEEAVPQTEPENGQKRPNPGKKQKNTGLRSKSTRTPKRKQGPATKFAKATSYYFTRTLSLISGVILAIWTTADKIDSAIWRVLVSQFKFFSYWVTLFADWIIDGMIRFIKWVPTRAGQSYCALFGVGTIITGLWITDEIRGAAITLEAAQASISQDQPVNIDDPIMARIGSEYIYLSDVEAAARSVGRLQAGETLALQTPITEELVSTFIDQRLLAEVAQRNDVDKELVLRARLRAARDRILAAAQIDKIIEAEVTDQQVILLYDAQADLTSLGEEIRIRHILVESRAEAVGIINSLEEGADFATLARRRSLDRGTAIHGGDTGYISRDMVSNEFGRIAFAISADTISPPFRTTEGWNVIKVLEKRESEKISFASVEENLRQFLTLRAIDNTLARLKDEYDVVIYNHNNDENDVSSGDDY